MKYLYSSYYTSSNQDKELIYFQNSLTYLETPFSRTVLFDAERILHKTKPTRGLLDLVKADDYSFHIATFGEKFIHLLLCCVERKVPNIKSTALLQQLFLLMPITLEETDVKNEMYIRRKQLRFHVHRFNERVSVRWFTNLKSNI